MNMYIAVISEIYVSVYHDHLQFWERENNQLVVEDLFPDLKEETSTYEILVQIFRYFKPKQLVYFKKLEAEAKTNFDDKEVRVNLIDIHEDEELTVQGDDEENLEEEYDDDLELETADEETSISLKPKEEAATGAAQKKKRKAPKVSPKEVDDLITNFYHDQSSETQKEILDGIKDLQKKLDDFINKN